MGLVAFFLLSCFSRESLVEIVVGEVLFRVEIAATPEQHRKGLMFRTGLDDGHGMLFVFEKEESLSFWMRNTGIPLSIAFIDADGEIIQISDMIPYSEESIVSKYPAKYALEVNRGEFSAGGVNVGDYVILPKFLR